MDYTLQKRCAKFIYVVPEGLRELMSDISREVLRSQPEQMYTFIADYLDALMITRENARVAARLVDEIIRIASMTVELLQSTGMSRPEADRMANVIQDAFKQYMQMKREPINYASQQEEEDEERDVVDDIVKKFGDLEEGRESAVTAIIENAFREFKGRHARERELLTGMIDWRVAARSAIYLYRKTGVTLEDANRAATLIKAAYKGYYTRRIMKRLLDEGRQLYDERGDEPEATVYEGEVVPRSPYDADEEESSRDESSSEMSEARRNLRHRAIASGVLSDLLQGVVPDDGRATAAPDEAPPSEVSGTEPPTETIDATTPTDVEDEADWLEESRWADDLPTDVEKHLREIVGGGEQSDVGEPLSEVEEPRPEVVTEEEEARAPEGEEGVVGETDVLPEEHEGAQGGEGEEAAVVPEGGGEPEAVAEEAPAIGEDGGDANKEGEGEVVEGQGEGEVGEGQGEEG